MPQNNPITGSYDSQGHLLTSFRAGDGKPMVGRIDERGHLLTYLKDGIVSPPGGGAFDSTWAAFKQLVLDLLSDAERNDNTYVLAVAEYVKSKLAREYNHDIELFQSYTISYLGMRVRLLGYSYTGDITTLRSAVRLFLGVDASRQGADDYINGMILQAQLDIEGMANNVENFIRQGVLDVQSNIPLYRIGHETKFQAADLTPIGATSVGTIPEGSKIRDVIRHSKVSGVNGITITNQGSGYTFANALVSGDGQGAALVAKIDGGRVIGFDVLDAGSGYTHAAIQIVGDGNGAQGTVLLGAGTQPLIPFDWRNRQELICGKAPINGNAFYFCADPYAKSFYVYPALDAQHYVTVTWDGSKIDFGETDIVPFDEPMADVVAEWVRAHLSRSNNQAWQSYMKPATGSYYMKRRRLYLDAANRQRMRDA